MILRSNLARQGRETFSPLLADAKRVGRHRGSEWISKYTKHKTDPSEMGSNESFLTDILGSPLGLFGIRDPFANPYRIESWPSAVAKYSKILFTVLVILEGP